MARDSHRLLPIPPRPSGALIFNCLGLQSGQIGYNVNPDQQVSHLEMTFPGSGFLAGSRLGELAATVYRLLPGADGAGRLCRHYRVPSPSSFRPSRPLSDPP